MLKSHTHTHTQNNQKAKKFFQPSDKFVYGGGECSSTFTDVDQTNPIQTTTLSSSSNVPTTQDEDSSSSLSISFAIVLISVLLMN